MSSDNAPKPVVNHLDQAELNSEVTVAYAEAGRRNLTLFHGSLAEVDFPISVGVRTDPKSNRNIPFAGVDIAIESITSSGMVFFRNPNVKTPLAYMDRGGSSDEFWSRVVQQKIKFGLVRSLDELPEDYLEELSR